MIFVEEREREKEGYGGVELWKEGSQQRESGEVCRDWRVCKKDGETVHKVSCV